MDVIKKLLDEIYKPLGRGNKITIPEELLDTYDEFKTQQWDKYGLANAASVKRVFMKKNLSRIYPDEYKIIRDGLYDEYYNKEYGLKLIARKLQYSYTSVRDIFSVFGIQIRKGYNVVTDRVCEFRTQKSKNEYKNRKGWFTTFDRKSHHTQRGVQGYYFNVTKNKYVWLRSSWEYIYAKWLNKNNIEWDVEVTSFQVNNKNYRPDFFIYDNLNLTKIVEIKGYWKDKQWKTTELNNKLDIDVIIVDDITKYIPIDSTYKKELGKWKQTRRLKI